MRKLLTSLIILTFASVSANAHQTYLFSDLYNMLAGKDNYLTMYNGTYYTSGYSITKKMSRDISIVMGGKRMTPEEAGGDVRDSDTNPKLVATYIGLVAKPNGTGMAGVAAHPDYIALPDTIFRDYLEHEGMTDALAEFDANNKLTTIRERYTKHAKAIFQVGKPYTDDYKTKLGYKIEIIPEKNPGQLKLNEDMSLQVLFEGKPLVNQTIFASYASFKPNHEGSVADGSKYNMRTDKNGRVTFKITKLDKWFVNMIHMQKVEDEDADYESNWATLTFAVQ